MPKPEPYTGPVFSIKASPEQRAALRSEAQRRGVSQSDLVRAGLTAVGVPLWEPIRQQ